MTFSVRPKPGLKFDIAEPNIDIDMLHEVEYAGLVFRRSSQQAPAKVVLGSNWVINSDEPTKYPGTGCITRRVLLIEYSTIRIGQI